MNSNDKTIEKVKYHIHRLSKTVSHFDSPLLQFIIKNDFDEDQVDEFYRQYSKRNPQWVSLHSFSDNQKSKKHKNNKTGAKTMHPSDELKKIKYHIRMLSNAIDTYESRFAKLVIDHDYSETQVEELHSIFDSYMKQPNPDWTKFEYELCSFTDDPRKLIDQFYDAGSWNRVCRRYKDYIASKKKEEETCTQ